MTMKFVIKVNDIVNIIVISNVLQDALSLKKFDKTKKKIWITRGVPDNV